ncbi:hypothetical protein Nepgr_025751 [Nepenthes gracilis]|uniref:Uncharacterized protein n=1 Tax=Nepenthes gracilis TaxID=150966 RepID=A0AAD3XZZ4_NEPGR|nr:hypothetical protein Nepgr_025751 [Nepenthes gracilis]
MNIDFVVPYRSRMTVVVLIIMGGIVIGRLGGHPATGSGAVCFLLFSGLVEDDRESVSRSRIIHIPFSKPRQRLSLSSLLNLVRQACYEVDISSMFKGKDTCFLCDFSQSQNSLRNLRTETKDLNVVHAIASEMEKTKATEAICMRQPTESNQECGKTCEDGYGERLKEEAESNRRHEWRSQELSGWQTTETLSGNWTRRRRGERKGGEGGGDKGDQRRESSGGRE